MVRVGFNESKRTFNQSRLEGFVFIERTGGEITTSLEMRVFGGIYLLSVVVSNVSADVEVLYMHFVCMTSVIT